MDLVSAVGLCNIGGEPTCVGPKPNEKKKSSKCEACLYDGKIEIFSPPSKAAAASREGNTANTTKLSVEVRDQREHAEGLGGVILLADV